MGLIAWLAARSRAWTFKRAAPAGTRAPLHSLPNYHGWYVALWAAVPAAIFAVIWNGISPGLILAQVTSHPAAASLPAFGIERDSMLAEAYAVAAGSAFGAFNPAANG
ncbi:MAG: phosphate ABC transporter permease family protein, partial [Brevundimonas sp.]|nr:phosphate ABC transporter permease family protein [Brevundimonas sp.]